VIYNVLMRTLNPTHSLTTADFLVNYSCHTYQKGIHYPASSIPSFQKMSHLTHKYIKLLNIGDCGDNESFLTRRRSYSYTNGEHSV